MDTNGSHVKRLSEALVRRLNLSDAVEAEADSVRNLLPDEPAWDRVKLESAAIAGYLENQLRAGFRPAPEAEISARKPGHGVRPVPYWGVLERITYRALTTTALSDAPELDRSPQAYLEFITAPGRYARDRQRAEAEDPILAFFFLSDSPVKYVVKSDITAFYQFIDHAVLAEEMLHLGVDFELIQALIELLAEVQGRNYGIPQVFEASDMLSELYADRIERELLRAGLAVWRFNDDFRIACDTYSDALTAIERLDAAARQVGLVLSDNKTVTVGIWRYMLDAFDLSPSNAGEILNVDNVEDLIGDYTDDFGEEDANEALAVIRRAQVRTTDVDPPVEENQWIKLRDLRSDDVRLLRRAVNGMIIAGDARAVPDVVRLAIYAPSLTPNLMRYLRTIGETLEPEAAAWKDLGASVDQLASDVALNAWQCLWLVDIVRELSLLDEALHGRSVVRPRVAWIDGLRRDTRNEALRAVAIRALAAHGILPLTTVIESAERTTDSLLHVYTSAARECAAAEDARTPEAITAWARSSKLHACLLLGAP